MVDFFKIDLFRFLKIGYLVHCRSVGAMCSVRETNQRAFRLSKSTVRSVLMDETK